MAKLKDLAGLAALGAIGYKLSQQGKDNVGEQTKSSYVPADTRTKGADMVSDVATDASAYSPRVTMNPMEDVGNAKNDPIAKSKSIASRPRGMTPGQNTMLANAGKPSKASSITDADALNAKAQAGNRDMQEQEEKYSMGPDSASKNLGSAVGSQKVQTDFTLGKKPTSEQASANRAAMAEGVKSAGSSVVDYFRNFETPTEARLRKAKEASGKKSGGSIKKMASGGMTSSASKRGDGIAAKGKTRGRLC